MAHTHIAGLVIVIGAVMLVGSMIEWFTSSEPITKDYYDYSVYYTPATYTNKNNIVSTNKPSYANYYYSVQNTIERYSDQTYYYGSLIHRNNTYDPKFGQVSISYNQNKEQTEDYNGYS